MAASCGTAQPTPPWVNVKVRNTRLIRVWLTCRAEEHSPRGHMLVQLDMDMEAVTVTSRLNHWPGGAGLHCQVEKIWLLQRPHGIR
jgi:hypothetical protein